MTTPDGLLPEEYQAVIAPAIHAAAQLAAARGDPYLYNDLSCMLTLMALVRDLADLYQDQWGALGQMSDRAVFAGAPMAACVMVLTEYEVEPDSIKSMSNALSRAYEQLAADGVFGQERVAVQKAWDAYLAKETKKVDAHMRQAATMTAAAIDGWEDSRSPG